MVLWSIDHKVSALKTFTEGGKFAIHILAGDQQDLCKTFSSKNVDRFSMCDWDFSENQLPIIEGAFAVLECKTFQGYRSRGSYGINWRGNRHSDGENGSYVISSQTFRINSC